MEEKDILEEQEREQYEPRPAWQRVGALIGVIIMIVAFVGYCLQIAMGGLG